MIRRSPPFLRRTPIALGLAALATLSLGGCFSSGSSSSPESEATLEDAIWVAWQDGDGAWETFDPAENNYVFSPEVTDADGRYAVFAIIASGESQSVSAVHLQLTTDDATEIDARRLFSEEFATLEVEIQDSDSYSFVDLYVGSQIGSRGWNTSFDRLQPGLHDLAAVGSGDSQDPFTPRTIVFERNIELNAGETANTSISFDGIADNISETPITIGLPSDNDIELHFSTAGLQTVNGTRVGLAYEEDKDDELLLYPLSGVLEHGDIYSVELWLTDQQEQHGYSYVKGFAEKEGFALTLPTSFSGEYDEAVVGDILLPGMTGASYTDESNNNLTPLGYTTEAAYYDAGNGVGYYLMSHSSANYLATQTSFQLPDMRAVAGWNPAWSIPVGSEQGGYAVSVQAGAGPIQTQDLGMWYLDDGVIPLEDGSIFASIYSIGGGGR